MNNNTSLEVTCEEHEIRMINNIRLYFGTTENRDVSLKLNVLFDYLSGVFVWCGAVRPRIRTEDGIG